MTPERKQMVGNKKVEEYYWAGKMVCYVDNHLSPFGFDFTIEELLRKQSQSEGEK